MKKLLILTVAILITLSQLSGTALAARPSYPWNSTYPYSLQTGQTRHHTIPWQQLTTFGVNEYNTAQKLTDFLNKFNSINQANLGEYQNVSELVQGYFNGESPAKETVSELFAWMQGNLVVGPSQRTNDPGEKFDTPAFNCRQYYYPNPAYNNLEQRWNGTANEKLQVFETLSTNAMSGNNTVNNHEPQCKW
ncbi:hypothetical protein [Oscillatoria salina]|uniref:hypothetical protein n=1 Tax=Oscillatoria salina TaxID=331517 RepID=UPI0013B688A7|nr:hypothetical protein [Oscillatoria salina]MBZ8179473.1 hypothetical protein [Oscillatoria salina IIICB1]NET89086.1 hypothetical protein [Kamptonema sp. SIO1D9]